MTTAVNQKVANPYYTESSGGVTINTSTITGGTSGNILYDNAGTVGELATTGTSRVVLNSSPMLTGNVGIGTTGGTPVAWSATYYSLQVGYGGSISNLVASSEMSVSSNLKYQGAYKYVNNGSASRYYQSGGFHFWASDTGTGVANTSALMNDVMTLNNVGDLNISGSMYGQNAFFDSLAPQTGNLYLNTGGASSTYIGNFGAGYFTILDDDNVQVSSLAGNTAVFTDGGQKLISKGTTGTGNVVLADNPALTNATNNGLTVGYLTIPQAAHNANYTTILSDSGKHLITAVGGITWTIPANASVAYDLGVAITFVNAASTSISIAIGGSDTLRLGGTTSTGTRTLAQYGIATAMKITSTSWIITGTGLT